PRDDEIDVWGLTHPGKVRKSNEDHFLLGALRKQFDIQATSLPFEDQLRACNERVGFIAMVADGVGGQAAGEEASRLALEEVTQYLTQSALCYYQSDAQADDFVDLLQEAATRSHQRVIERARADTDLRGMATTLTLWIGVWPWIYLLQVGDSRYYLYRNGVLTQVTRDQTMAQELIDQGVMARPAALASPWVNVLSSAIGGEQTAPVVTRLPAGWENTHLICSDGLTKHVSDERIAGRLAAMTSARETCEALLQDALDGGGTDNITIIVGHAVREDRA
ncbi:MAG TPA: PP2C family serine/threonine-protein phosphatase, partial [Candidatus Elarobacter sp.]|nr:PP2C family serine/threonine-protein phosphatase [Candidatus Elarobacter sp.]